MLYDFFLILCALLPFQFALNPTPGIDLAVIRVIIPAIFLAWAISNFKKNFNSLKKDRVAVLILIFLFLAVLSLIFSDKFSWSFRKLLFLFSLFPIYFVSASLSEDANRRRSIIKALVLGGSMAAFCGLMQFFSQFIFGIDSVYSFMAQKISPFFLGNSFSKAVLAYPSWLVNSGGMTYMRTISVFPDPHMFSYYMELLIPWSIYLWATSLSHKKFFLFSSILLILADISSFTRGSYVALIASSFAILPLVSRSSAKKLLLGAFALFFLFFIVPKNPVAQRLASSFDVNEGSNHERIANWKQALPIIYYHPFGVGIGMYSMSVKPTADYREPIYAHDLYLDIAAELGIPALLVFAGILFSVFMFFWKNSQKDVFFVAGVFSMTLFGVHSLVENPLYSVHVLPLFLIIISLGKILKKNDEKTAFNK
jgi:O-antigen ligase